MGLRFHFDWKRRLKGEHGAVAVEFAILAPVFLLLAFGIFDLGHAYYMKQVVTNASREGARYAARYTTDTDGNHLKPSAYNPSIPTWVTTKYSSLLPTDADLQVPTPEGAGYATGTAGADLSVTVNATKHWWVLGNLGLGLGSTATISSTTWMKVE